MWEWDSIKFSGVKEKAVDGPMWLLWFISELTDTFSNYSPTVLLRVFHLGLFVGEKIIYYILLTQLFYHNCNVTDS